MSDNTDGWLCPRCGISNSPDLKTCKSKKCVAHMENNNNGENQEILLNEVK